MLENRKVYEIHHRDNAYNFLETHAYNGSTVRKRIAHIENGFTDIVRYYSSTGSTTATSSASARRPASGGGPTA